MEEHNHISVVALLMYICKHYARGCLRWIGAGLASHTLHTGSGTTRATCVVAGSASDGLEVGVQTSGAGRTRRARRLAGQTVRA